jgi:hypothetical protein
MSWRVQCSERSVQMSQADEECHPKIFISYSHDSLEHRTKVWNLAKKLRSDGINAVIDQYTPAPEPGFPRWMEDQIESADFVLLVCTEVYLRCVRGKEAPGKGYGVLWEGHLIYQYIYDDGTRNSRFIPVLFEDGRASNIPKPLRAFTYYYVDSPEGYEDLYRRISAQSKWLAPPLGSLKTLPPDRVEESVRIDPAQSQVSAALKELLAARSNQDLERVRALVAALLNEYPDHPDVHLLHGQVQQAIHLELAQVVRRAPALRRIQYSVPFIAALLLLVVLTLLLTGPSRALQTAGQVIRGAMDVLTGRVPTPPPPPPPPPGNPRKISIITLRNGMVIPSGEVPTVAGNTGGPEPAFVYLLHRYFHEPYWIVDRPLVKADRSWVLDKSVPSEFALHFRRGSPSAQLEILAVDSPSPMDSRRIYPQELSRPGIAVSNIYRVSIVP